ncbi:MAG: CHAT domain-containing protein [Planctomycetota bacterium]
MCQEAAERVAERDSLLVELQRLERRDVDAVPPEEPPDFERYDLGREVGRGGQGIVYEATQRSTGRTVAVKLLREDWTQDARRRQRIEREVAVLGRIAHPNVCPVLDLISREGRAGVVMPLLDGEPLQQRIDAAATIFRESGDPQRAWTAMVECAGEPGPASSSSRLGGLHLVLRLVERIAGAVDAVHRAGVIHRDLKPGNVLLSRDGRPIVLDFGLALDLRDPRSRLTREGEFNGTPCSMAPEQVRGELDAVGVRTDVYALGVLLYQMLAFRAPFTGPVPVVLRRVGEGRHAPLRRVNSAVPRDLEAVCARAMETEPGRRYASAAELADDLRRVRCLEPTVAKPPSVASRVLRRVRRNVGVSVALGVCVLLAAGLLALVLGLLDLGRDLEAAARVLRGEALPGDQEAVDDRFGDGFSESSHDEALDQAAGALTLQEVLDLVLSRSPDAALALRYPRAGIRDPRPVFRLSAPAPGGRDRSFRVRLTDLSSGERWRLQTVQKAGEGDFQVELPPGVSLAVGSRFEWTVKQDGPGPAVFDAESAEFFVLAPEAAPSRSSGDGFDARLTFASELLAAGLAAEALVAIEALPVPPGDLVLERVARVRVEALLALGRNEDARRAAEQALGELERDGERSSSKAAGEERTDQEDGSMDLRVSAGAVLPAVFLTSGLAAQAQVDLDVRVHVQAGREAQAPPPAFEVAAAGTLFAWATSEALDLTLVLEDEEGYELTEDDDSGGGGDPWAIVDVVAGERVTLRVDAAEGEGEVRAVAFVASESEATRAAAAEVERRAESVERAGGEDLDAVTELLGAAPEHGGSLAPGELDRSEALALAHERLAAAILDFRQILGQEAFAPERAAALERALAFVASAHPPRHPRVRGLELALAVERELCGQPELARELLLRAHASASCEPPTAPLELQEIRYRLGRLQRLSGRPLEAIALFGAFLADADDVRGDERFLGSVRWHLRNVLIELRDFYAALDVAELVVKDFERMAGAGSLEAAQARVMRAFARIETGDVERGLEELRAEARARAEQHGERDAVVLDAKERIAGTLLGQGRLEEALALREELWEAWQRVEGVSEETLLIVERNLLVTRSIAGGHAGVDDDLARIAAVHRARGDRAEEINTRKGLAWHHVREGDAERARAEVRELTELLIDRAQLYAVSLAPREADAAGENVDGLHTALSIGAEVPELGGALFTLVESMRSVGLRSARVRRRARGDAALTTTLAEIDELNQRIAGVARSGEPMEARASLRIRRDALDARLRSGSAAGGSLAVPTPAAVAQRLAPRDAVVSYRRYQHAVVSPGERDLSGADAFLALVLRSDGTVRAVPLGPAASVEEACEDWRAAVEREDGELVAKRGVALRELVLDPVLAEIDDPSRVFLLLDDALHTVPLDSLPLGDGLVGDGLRVELRASAWELLEDGAASRGAPTLLALGAVDYGAAPAPGARDEGALAQLVRSHDGSFLPLSKSGPEAETAAALFREHLGGTARVVTGAAARRDVLREAAGTTIVHLAVHGYFSAEILAKTQDWARAASLHSMLLSGLALAGANRPPDAGGRIEGIVTAEELAGFDLSGCQMVVLSACETSSGVSRSGQGLASLQRGARMAGAEAALTSLWRIRDEAAYELMCAFYRFLCKERLSIHESLWEAKRELRAAGRPAVEWAGWVLIGDPELGLE